MELFVDACDTDHALEGRRRLASAAFLFAQVAEHLERGGSLTHELAERCHATLPLVRDDQVRRKIEILLTREANQPRRAPQSDLLAAAE
jgi:hypothetical protein